MKRPDVLLCTPDEARCRLATEGIEDVEWGYTVAPGQRANGGDERVVRQRWPRPGVAQLLVAHGQAASLEPRNSGL